jgi:pentatricopeptide repeat protein
MAIASSVARSLPEFQAFSRPSRFLEGFPTSFKMRGRTCLRYNSTSPVRGTNARCDIQEGTDISQAFINALVQAGRTSACIAQTKERCYGIAYKKQHHRTQLTRPLKNGHEKRWLHTAARNVVPQDGVHGIYSSTELMDLVDFYDFESAGLSSSGLTMYTSNLKERTLDGKSQKPPNPAQPSPKQPGSLCPEAEVAIAELRKLLADETSSHEAIYNVYSTIPSPAAASLPITTLRHLLRHLSVVAVRDDASKLRYMAILDEMKASKIPITTAEWTSAISFAGKCLRRISSTELHSALQLWREMENQAGVRGSYVTFNVLYDIAAKAGKFPLAKLIIQEMQSRKLTFNRYFWTSYIYSNGLQGDGDGVRRAYRELVEIGEIVDTVVLNCVISSLINAGEATAAEMVYERMKTLHAFKQEGRQLPNDWRRVRDIGRLLEKAADFLRSDTPSRKLFQTLSPIAPDVRTFKTLIKYHALSSGNIERVLELIKDMLSFGIPLEGFVFFLLLRGFHLHGGIRYTSWTQARLEAVWKAFNESWKAMPDRLFMTPSMANACLSAYAKCTDEPRTIAIWEMLKGQWNPKESEMEAVNRGLRDIVNSFEFSNTGR